jgi:hypothetical protein
MFAKFSVFAHFPFCQIRADALAGQTFEEVRWFNINANFHKTI